MRISLVLAGRMIPGLNPLADSLSRVFHCPVSLEFMDFPLTRSFRKSRNQYDADVLLRELARFADSGAMTVFVVHEDLCSASEGFVFAHAISGCAVVSVTRLDPRFYGPAGDMQKAGALFKERIRKEILHELGRLCGLPVCDDGKCVMAPSHSIDAVDFKEEEFCQRCRKALHLEG